MSEGGYKRASHGYAHILVHHQSPEEFREDISRAKGILEEIIGDRVLGYRAPSFSITPWAVEIIKEMGYQYDSSLMPASLSLNKRYGNFQGLERLMETKRPVDTEKPPVPLRRWNSARKNPRFHFVGGNGMER